jgi:elongation factor G
MKNYDAKDIRNVVLAGHASKGKTTLAEALLSCAGATERFGKVADGTTVMDYDSEEKKGAFPSPQQLLPLNIKIRRLTL